MKQLFHDYLIVFRFAIRQALWALLRAIPFCIICQYIFNIDFKWPLIVFVLNAIFKIIKCKL